MVRYCRLFNVFDVFSCEIGNPHVFSHSGIKVADVFPISNLAVTTRIKINYSRANFFFSSGSLNRNSVFTLHLRSKNYFQFKYGKSRSIVRPSLFLKSSESLPKYGKNESSFPLRKHEIKVFFDK